MDRPFILGITGGIACGKSTIVRLLAERGATILDADRVYHDLIQQGEPLHTALVQAFGERILDEQGAIDRGILGREVFRDTESLADLERMTHPHVITEIWRRVARASSPVVVIDAVKLIESGLADDCDAVWLVTCDEREQRRRLMKNRGLSASDADQRIAAQPSVKIRMSRVDVVLDNSGDFVALKTAVDNAWKQIVAGQHDNRR